MAFGIMALAITKTYSECLGATTISIMTLIIMTNTMYES
jgi:hypothetical protein